MNTSEKLEKILQAILAAREKENISSFERFEKFSKDNKDILNKVTIRPSILALPLKIVIAHENSLSTIGRNEVLKILESLQSKNILTLESRNYPNPVKEETITGFSTEIDEKTGKKTYIQMPSFIRKTPQPDPFAIHLTLDGSFDNWYIAYLLEKKQMLVNLDQLQLENIYNTVLDIDERLQINPSTTVRIKLEQECRFPFLDDKCDGIMHSAEYRQDALVFLANQHVVTNVQVEHSDCADTMMVYVFLNIEKFQRFKEEIAKVFETRNKRSPSNNEAVYTVSYNEMTGEILINDTVVKKTNLDSLVDNLFAYLQKNPNRKITLDELQQATNKTIKDLPKIIESAGFTGNRLRAFFRVSKDVIYFRPQITRTDLDKLSITAIE